MVVGERLAHELVVGSPAGHLERAGAYRRLERDVRAGVVHVLLAGDVGDAEVYPVPLNGELLDWELHRVGVYDDQRLEVVVDEADRTVNGLGVLETSVAVAPLDVVRGQFAPSAMELDARLQIHGHRRQVIGQ